MKTTKSQSISLDTIVHADAVDFCNSLPSASVDLMFTSPPYLGVKFWADRGLSGEDICSTIINLCCALADKIKPGGYVVWNIGDIPGGNDGLNSLLWHVEEAMLWDNFTLRGHVIWAKGVTGPLPPPCFMRRPCIPHLTHEDILIFVKGDWKAREPKITLEPEEKQWLANSVWSIPAAMSTNIKDGRAKRKLTMPFPVALAERVVRLFSLPGDVVLDPFMGCGTTAVAAKWYGRHYIGCDIDPDCVKYANDELSRVELKSWLKETKP